MEELERYWVNEGKIKTMTDENSIARGGKWDGFFSSVSHQRFAGKVIGDVKRLTHPANNDNKRYDEMVRISPSGKRISFVSRLSEVVSGVRDKRSLSGKDIGGVSAKTDIVGYSPDTGKCEILLENTCFNPNLREINANPNCPNGIGGSQLFAGDYAWIDDEVIAGVSTELPNDFCDWNDFSGNCFWMDSSFASRAFLSFYKLGTQPKKATYDLTQLIRGFFSDAKNDEIRKAINWNEDNWHERKAIVKAPESLVYLPSKRELRIAYHIPTPGGGIQTPFFQVFEFDEHFSDFKYRVEAPVTPDTPLGSYPIIEQGEFRPTKLRLGFSSGKENRPYERDCLEVCLKERAIKSGQTGMESLVGKLAISREGNAHIIFSAVEKYGGERFHMRELTKFEERGDSYNSGLVIYNTNYGRVQDMSFSDDLHFFSAHGNVLAVDLREGKIKIGK